MHIHIITLPNKPLRDSYVISKFAISWVKMGFEVTSGPTRVLEADIGILHIDATSVPSCYLPETCGRPLLNERVLDISKRHISKNLLDQDTDYSGPVIIKTDDNCFGNHELRQLPFFSLRRFRRKITKAFPQIPWQLSRELPRKTYPILKHIGDVPSWVWKRTDLVVERFFPEIEDGYYVLRVWLFLGNQNYNIKMFGTEPIVKAKNIIKKEIVETIPDSLKQIRKKLGMDYGKFDYVMNDEKAILLDVNKTPTTVADGEPSENLKRVASGIMDFF
jgi:ribosome biogenesis SPOUT family RNA methylase Rps3